MYRFSFVLVLLFLVGCMADGGKVTVREVLKNNPTADIFQYNGFVYSNVTELDWFNDKKENYKKNSLVGEIKKKSTRVLGFKDLTATTLPVGTKIYTTSENEDDVGILIVEYEGKDMYFMRLLEG
ncbi:hypothetical protein ACLM5H_16740 [Fredinandcohnia humi]